MQTDPWIFGWNQVFTIIGFLITVGIAVGGFRTFGRWKKEKIEERRIEIALETLAITYESKYIFDAIRSPMSFEYEWKDMPRLEQETDAQWKQRGPFYAVGSRIVKNKDFFERVFKLQPQCMAIFGSPAEAIFLLLHKARRSIEVSSDMLSWKVHNSAGAQPSQDAEFWDQCRRDIWDVGETEKDRVGKQLIEFRQRMEALCRPVIDRNVGDKLVAARALLESSITNSIMRIVFNVLFP